MDINLENIEVSKSYPVSTQIALTEWYLDTTHDTSQPGSQEARFSG